MNQLHKANHQNLQEEMLVKPDIEAIEPNINAAAESIGVSNLDFTVRRNVMDEQGVNTGDYVEESDWFVQSVYDRPDQDGNSIKFVKIIKNSADEGKEKLGFPYKTIKVSDLLSWQDETEVVDTNNPKVKLGKIVTAQSVESPDEDTSISRAKKLFLSSTEQDDYSYILNGELDELLDGMDSEEIAKFDKWRIEQAAKRPKRLDELLNSAEKRGNNVPYIAKENIDELRNSLEASGVRDVFEDEPTEASIRGGVERAQDLVARGLAGKELADEPFMGNAEFQNLVNNALSSQQMWLELPIYVNPAAINGAEGFDSWEGRGDHGFGEVSDRESNSCNATRRSIDQIIDYATRDTQIKPNSDGELNIFITKDGIRTYTVGSHRAAAAKLRDEPLGYKSVTIYRV